MTTNLFPTFTIPVPAYLPEPVRRSLAGRQVRVELPKGARRRIRTSDRLPPSEWNERHRRIPAGESHPGPWRREYAPHAPFILDLCAMPWLRELWYCGPERDGKTNILLGYAGWCIDSRPGNVYYLMPSEVKANQIINEKFIPMLEESPRLASLLGDRRVDVTQTLIRLNNGVRIFPAHARSATSLASFSAILGIGDEVDKYDGTVGKETDPITLLKKRLREYGNRSKLLLASTPAGRFIYNGASTCRSVIVTHLQCPTCGEYHHAGEEGLHIPDGATVETLMSGEHVAHQACTHCGALWDEADLESARRNMRFADHKTGQHLTLKHLETQRPETVGLLRTAWDCHLIPLREIAIAKVKADTGDLAAKRDWVHGYKCEDMEKEVVTREEDEILTLCDDRPTGVVPSVPLVAVLMTVDTQGDHFWYVIRAHGYGMDQETWQIRCGQVQTFAALERLMYDTEFYTADGKPFRVTNVAIDTGGTRIEGEENSRTYQVYDWVRKHPMVYPFKGAKRHAAPFRVSNIDFYPNSNKPIPGGLRLYNVNANHYKDELDRRLRIQPTDPGAFHLHCGREAHQLEMKVPPPSNLREYARHMVGEHRDERGQWEPRKNRRHDLWDCEYMQIALADILDLRYEAPPGSEPHPNRPKQTGNDTERRKSTRRPGRW